MYFKGFKNNLNISQSLEGIPKNYLNALDTWETFQEPNCQNVAITVKTINFGSLEKPLGPAMDLKGVKNCKKHANIWWVPLVII